MQHARAVRHARAHAPRLCTCARGPSLAPTCLWSTRQTPRGLLARAWPGRGQPVAGVRAWRGCAPRGRAGVRRRPHGDLLGVRGAARGVVCTGAVGEVAELALALLGVVCAEHEHDNVPAARHQRLVSAPTHKPTHTRVSAGFSSTRVRSHTVRGIFKGAGCGGSLPGAAAVGDSSGLKDYVLARARVPGGGDAAVAQVGDLPARAETGGGGAVGRWGVHRRRHTYDGKP